MIRNPISQIKATKMEWEGGPEWSIIAPSICRLEELAWHIMSGSTRSHFGNYQEYLDLYGAERIIAEINRLRISSQRLLPDAIKAQLGIAEPEAVGIR